MAATLLKRSAVVWVPPRSIGERALVSEPSLLVGLPGAGDAAPRWTRTSIEALPAMKSAILVFDARDVTLLGVRLPPLSGVRLARALPNLVEDSILQDANACAIAIGPTVADDRRVLAVIDRGWLEFVVGAFERRGVRLQGAWPGQLALPQSEGAWSVSLVNGGVAVRTGPADGFGWTAGPGPQARTEAVFGAIEAASVAAPQSAVRPSRVAVFADDPGWRPMAEAALARLGMSCEFNDLATGASSPVDLLSAREGSVGSRWVANVDWRAWRVPAALAAACLVAFLAGLNLHWASLARERDALRAQMEVVFRQAFPNAQVVVDPLLQMQRQVSDLRLGSGASGPADYLPLMSRLSQALGARATDALASLEYRDGRLRARFRAGFFEGPSARDALGAACQQRGLRVEFEGEGDATLAIVGPA